MAMFKLKIEGWQDIKNYIKSLDDQGKAILNDVARSGPEYAQPLVKNAVANIDPELVPTVRVKQTKGKSKTRSTATLEVGGKKKSQYAFHLETGHGHDKSSSARPYMRPTIDHESNKIVEHMKDVFIQKVGVQQNG